MELKYKDMIKALNAVEEERNIPMSVILDALQIAMVKAYQKDSGLEDLDVEAEINNTKKTIDLYQNYVVVEEVEDNEFEMSLGEAKKINPNVQLGEKVRRKIEINGMSRLAAGVAKNIMRQKIREAEKVAIYDEYIKQLHEMVLGVVESVKDKFTLVNLGKTVALMPHSATIPNERIYEGQKLRVVITEVSRETKGSQVLVSRADAMLVRRLFEKEVPEIFTGTIEIKAIARDAGERTKMAVVSHNPDVDPIGACIGPRGQRVSTIIEELHGEKIDIFEWSEDITELVKNALAPAEIIAVVPQEDTRSLLVIVHEDQLSLAIGKRGKNARLAVKLVGRKIDIKTKTELEDMGQDFDALLEKAQAFKEQYQKIAQEKQLQKQLQQQKQQEQKRLEVVAKLQSENKYEEEEEEIIPEEMAEVVSEKLHYDLQMEEKDDEEQVDEEMSNEVLQADEQVEMEIEEETDQEEDFEASESVETPMEKQTKKKHANLEEMAAKNTYVSVFEKLAESSKPKVEVKKKKKKKQNDDDYNVNTKELQEQIKKNLASKVDNGPIYSEEELAEIEAQQDDYDDYDYDIDYDDYYDEDDQ